MNHDTWQKLAGELNGGPILTPGPHAFYFPESGLTEPPDREAWAMDRCRRALEALDEPARRRALDWLTARLLPPP